MAQSQPLRLQAKRVNRVAGWVLAVPVGFLWVLAILFAELSFVMLFNHGVSGLTLCLVTGLICFLFLLTGKVHNALAVYEFTLQGVSKRSPLWEQRANWLSSICLLSSVLSEYPMASFSLGRMNKRFSSHPARQRFGITFALVCLQNGRVNAA
jgi:hypothetical protein